MILKLILASTLLLTISPKALAQRVNQQAFIPAVAVPQPFALQLTEHGIREGRLRPDDFSRLADDFATFRPESSFVVQVKTNAHRRGESAQRVKSHQPRSLLSPLNDKPPRGGCEYITYAPSPHLPREAERRRAVWYPAMVEAACEAGVPINLFDALIIQESRYNPVAVSPKGATGLAQLMPSSARILGVRNILDPRENMRGGARYLRSLLDEFGRFDLALAAYNAGAGRVRATGRVPRITETIHYVSSILVTMQRQLSAPLPLRE